MDKHNVWLKKKKKKAALKVETDRQYHVKWKKKYVKDKTMTSKNATLICLYMGKIHPLYDIEKKISQSFELNETNI